MQLNKKFKTKYVLVAFPSFGMVGNIALEYLKENLSFEKVGEIFVEKEKPMVIIHNGELIEPITLYYNKKFSLSIIQGLTKASKVEDKVAEKIVKFANSVGAKQIITIDGARGVGNKVYFGVKNLDTSRLEKLGVEELSNGVVMGVTAALMIHTKSSLSLFAETESQLPDSKAAAKIIRLLDKYLKMNIDYKPLLDQAKVFESKLKKIMEKKFNATDSKEPDYFG